MSAQQTVTEFSLFSLFSPRTCASVLHFIQPNAIVRRSVRGKNLARSYAYSFDAESNGKEYSVPQNGNNNSNNGSKHTGIRQAHELDFQSGAELAVPFHGFSPGTELRSKKRLDEFPYEFRRQLKHQQPRISSRSTLRTVFIATPFVWDIFQRMLHGVEPANSGQRATSAMWKKRSKCLSNDGWIRFRLIFFFFFLFICVHRILLGC